MLPAAQAPTSAPVASAAAACDVETFARQARSSLGVAYRGALAVVDRRADAEDVAQDALLAAFEKLDTCRDAACFRSWLLQIVRNRALNWLDRRRLRDVPGVLPQGGADGPDGTGFEPRGELLFPVLPDVGLRRHLHAALARLRPTQRTVVLLHDVEGWTHQEIAEHLGTSVLMSRKHLFQARGQLRRTLTEALEPPAPPLAGRQGNDPGEGAKPPGNTSARSPVLLVRRSAPAARPAGRRAARDLPARSATG